MRRPSPVRPLRHLAPALGLALALGFLPGAPAGAQSPAAPAPAAGPGQGDGGIAYRLVDTWEKRPWELTAGRYGEVLDISSAPDGTTFVLDGRYRAVHVLAPDGDPLAVYPLDDRGTWFASRLDAGWDGTFFVLSDGPQNGDQYLSRVDQYNANGTRQRDDGSPLLQVELPNLTPRAYADLAVDPDGRVFLTRTGPQNPYVDFPGPTPTAMPTGSPPLNGIEVRAADGALVTRFGMEHLCMPDSLDVAADGTTYVVNLCPSPFGNGLPGPTPTPRPSFGGARPAAAPGQQTEPEAEGVLVFGADHKLARKERFVSAEDIAVGPAGVFVSRNIEIFALGEREPLYASPSGRTYAAFFGEVVFHLDVPATGGLRAGMNHCLFQGVLDFARPADRPATPVLRGALDQPELEGPVFPLRVAAGDGLAVLQGGYTRSSGNPPQYWVMPYANGNQVAQRWRFDGSLASQVGLCSDYASGPVRDVAMDGDDIYVVDQNLIQRRPDDLLPAWSYWPALDDEPDVSALLMAVSARAGRVAALDVGADRVIVVDRDMRLMGRWPVAAAGEAAPADLALGDDRVFLADSAHGRVLVRGLDGRNLGAWPLHEGSRGIAVGPTGDVFTIGRGGWGYHYTAGGVLRTAWPMPDPTVEALDIAVGPDGRVYVPWLERSDLGGDGEGLGLQITELRRAGIWVFEAAAGPPPQAPPPAEACVAVPDKQAAPARIPLGDEVNVKLSVQGRCPGRALPAQVAMVFDTSRSMSFDSSIMDARAGALALLDNLDASTAEVALLTFDDAAAMRQPLTRDFAAVRTALAGLTALGDTRMSTGIDAARLELTGSRANPSARRVIVVVTDGLPKDDPLPAAEAARAAGLDVFVLIYNSWEFQESDLAFMQTVAGGAERVILRPLPARLETFGHDLTGYVDTTGLFQSITVRDVIPANMRYVADSARPPARLEGGDTLVWTFSDIPESQTLGMGYRLRPLEVGTWPTNVEATAPYTDALGFGGRLVFPVPRVTVWTVDRKTSIYLPYLSRGQCLRPERPLDVALALDTSSSMREAEPGTGLTKLEAATAAAAAFVDLLHLPRDHGALVTFDRAAVRRVDLTGDGAALKAALANLPTAQGTRIDQGLVFSGAALAAGGRPEARQVVVLLTDGIQSVGTPADVLAAADTLKARGILIYTIGLGADVQPDLLRAVASSPDRYFDSPSAADLEEIYRQISERLACE